MSNLICVDVSPRRLLEFIERVSHPWPGGGRTIDSVQASRVQVWMIASLPIGNGMGNAAVMTRLDRESAEWAFGTLKAAVEHGASRKGPESRAAFSSGMGEPSLRCQL